jgi:putative heme-binding domain-containing protein
MRSRIIALVGITGLGLFLGLSSRGQAPKKPVKKDPGPLTPALAMKRMKAAKDLRLDQVLTDPVVTQPIYMNFDERGRLWVVQYRQYPYPAGIKILSEDKFLRATYDKVPPPPPHHFKGRDKITIHEDTKGTGVFDRHKTFVKGLNIVTSCVRGRGGVWVLNPPYLLFYRDKDNDDVPDGDPVVHLEGFGLEDTHSCANSLSWGPDGWLYACQGSTVSGHVKHYGVKEPAVHSMGQLIWRYHPETRRYEIFAEGGGNAFGLDIDAKGRIYSGYNGGNTRGFHYVQGGYYLKGFAKHGPLSNPYSFGYFQPMKHPNVPRFTHDFLIYEGDSLPKKYHGHLFGVAPLLSHIVCSKVTSDGSSFQTRDVSFPLTSTDSWFRPVNIKVGPDGSLYVADMYEGQIAHLRHHEGKVDISNGRIYRLQNPGARPLKPFDLGKKTTAELVQVLRHKNKWFRQSALRLLGDRKDRSAIPPLRKMLDASIGQDALEALWGLNLSGGWSDSLATHTLDHKDPYVRLWTVRLLGDAKHVSRPIARRLGEMAQQEGNLAARSQLACTAKRLPAEDALPIVRGLLAHNEDVEDIHVPLLLWWAVESNCQDHRDRVLEMFREPAVWKLPLVKKHLLHRLMRRFAAAGTRKDLITCAQLLRLSPGAEYSKALMRGFEEAYHGRPLGSLPAELAEALARFGGTSLALQVRQNKPEAVAKALTVIANDKADSNERLQYVQIFGEVKQSKCVPTLLALVSGARDEALRIAALTSLQLYNDHKIAAAVIRDYSKLTDDSRAVAHTLLTSRKPWVVHLLTAVEKGKIDKDTIPLDVVRKMTVHRDDHIVRLVRKFWGNVEGATTAEMQKQIERLAGVLRTGKGSPYQGKKLFKDTCAKCHRLFGQGNDVGPDLTSYKRDDIGNMLANIVNPSAEIREGYETYQVTTADGRIVTGLLVDKDRQVLVLRTSEGQKITLAKDKVEEVAPQRKSLMPEDLLKTMSDQQVRDLFAYLRSTQPLNN